MIRFLQVRKGQWSAFPSGQREADDQVSLGKESIMISFLRQGETNDQVPPVDKERPMISFLSSGKLRPMIRFLWAKRSQWLGFSAQGEAHNQVYMCEERPIIRFPQVRRGPRSVFLQGTRKGPWPVSSVFTIQSLSLRWTKSSYAAGMLQMLKIFLGQGHVPLKMYCTAVT